MYNTTSPRRAYRSVSIALTLLLAALCLFGAEAFNSINRNHQLRRYSQLNMGLGDILKKALANDESLPPAQNPGLSRQPDPVEVEFLPCKKKVKAFPGQGFPMIATAAGVKIPYKCQKGDCGTCTVEFNGKMVKACQSSLPATRGTNIKYVIKVPDKPPVGVNKKGK